MSRCRIPLGAMTGAVLVLVLWSSVPGASAADDGPFGSYQLAAAAHGYELIYGDRVDGTVPDAAATFDTGGIGYGRAAIAWPGALAANAGDLVILASAGQIPSEMEPTFRLLNDPVRAEARSPGGPAEASYEEVPGVTMRSSADGVGAAAHAAIQQAEAPGAGSFGSASASSTTRLSDTEALAEGSSTVTDIVLAAGLIEIDSVLSTATARSDGVAGSGTAGTTVNGVTVAGQPATIDEDGLRLGSGDASPVNDVVNQLAEDALAEAGVQVIVSEPVVEVNGPAARAGAGAVLIVFASGSQRVAVQLGGASAVAGAAPGFDIALPATPLPSRALPARPGAGSGTGVLPTPAATGSPAPSPDVPDVSQPTALVVAFGHANPVWLAVLGSIGVAFFAGLLRRLGTGILDWSILCEAEEPL